MCGNSVRKALRIASSKSHMNELHSKLITCSLTYLNKWRYAAVVLRLIKQKQNGMTLEKSTKKNKNMSETQSLKYLKAKQQIYLCN